MISGFDIIENIIWSCVCIFFINIFTYDYIRVIFRHCCRIYFLQLNLIHLLSTTMSLDTMLTVSDGMVVFKFTYSQDWWYFIQHTEAQARWSPFSRRYFQMHFLEWKCMNFKLVCTKVFFKGKINNIPSLVQIKARRLSGDNPLFESMMVSLLTHICVTRPQWAKTHRGRYKMTAVYRRHYQIYFLERKL